MIKRIGRYMLNAISGTFFVFLMLLIAFWIRSHWRADRFVYEKAGNNYDLWSPMNPCRYTLMSSAGGIGICSWKLGRSTGAWDWHVSSSPQYPFYSRTPIDSSPKPAKYFITSNFALENFGMPTSLIMSTKSSAAPGFTGGKWGFDAAGMSNSFRVWIFPYWAAVVPLGLLTIVTTRMKFRAWRRVGRINKGLCSICGYDLRCTPDRCPECGAIPVAAKEVTL